MVELDNERMLIRRKLKAVRKAKNSNLAISKVCTKHAEDSLGFNGCVYCERLNQIDYSASLQKFVECLIDGREVPLRVLEACPHHAELYKQSLSREGCDVETKETKQTPARNKDRI